MRCSVDLRQRVVDFVRSGGSKAEAARRFKVGEASVYRWLKPGGVAYKRPNNRGHILQYDTNRKTVGSSLVIQHFSFAPYAFGLARRASCMLTNTC